MGRNHIPELATRARLVLGRRRAALWIACAGVLLASPSLFAGFAGDDHYFRMVFQGFPGLPRLTGSPLDTFTFADGDPDQNLIRKEWGLLPWWAVEDARLSFWRPVVSLTHFLDWVFWGDHAWPMHVHNLLWYALLCVLVAALYRRFDQRAWVAGVAALLYAVDDAHGMPVGWISNRNGIMATVFGVAVLLFHDKWRRDGRRSGTILASCSLALGLLCGEATVAVGGYLFAYALFLDRGRFVQRMAVLLPYGGLVLAYGVVRHYLGYGTTGSGLYRDPSDGVLSFALDVMRHTPLLLLGQLAVPNSAVWKLAPAFWAHVHLTSAVVFVAFTGWVLWPLLRRDPTARFWAVGALLATVPSCATFPQDRLLFYTGLGCMALVAKLLTSWAECPAWLPKTKTWQRSARLLTGAWVGIHCVFSPLMLPLNSVTMGMIGNGLSRACDSLPNGPDVSEQTVIIVNSPMDLVTIALPVMRSSQRQPIPKHTWAFTAGVDPVQLTRVDEHTLLVRPELGFARSPYANMFRGASRPVSMGYTVRLSGLTIEVVSMTPDARPQEAAFHFDASVEDPSLRWFVMGDRHFVPFTPPAVGKRVHLRAINPLWWM